MKFGNLNVREDRTGKSIAFFSTETSSGVTRSLIRDMIGWSKRHDNCDLRVCLHRSRDELFHQMIILQHKNVYHRPHVEAHTEGCQIIQGKMAIFRFQPDGTVLDNIVLDSNRTLVYRMYKGVWHTNVPLTPIVIFHEIKRGPLKEKDRIFASWAPSDAKEGMKFIQRLLNEI